MDQPLEIIELEMKPIPPDTAASVKEQVLPAIEAALATAGHGELLSSGQVQIEVEKTFPTDPAVVVLLTFFSAVALEVFKEIVLPELERRFETRSKPRRRKKSTGAKK